MAIKASAEKIGWSQKCILFDLDVASFKKEAMEEAMEKAKKVASDSFSSAEARKLAKQLATEAFNSFKTRLSKEYPGKEDQDWLKVVFGDQFSYFSVSFLYEIKKALIKRPGDK